MARCVIHVRFLGFSSGLVVEPWPHCLPEILDLCGWGRAIHDNDVANLRPFRDTPTDFAVLAEVFPPVLFMSRQSPSGR